MPRPILRAVASVVAALALASMVGCRGDLGPRAPSATVRPAPITPVKADRVVVVKHRRILELWAGRKLLGTYPIALGPHPRGPKRRAGDGRTPEGVYLIDGRSADTRYYRELHISYPDAADRARARAEHAKPGGAIFIHGLPLEYGDFNPLRFYRDWTEGCIAVSNVAIDKIWKEVPDGTVVDIRP